MKNAMSKIKLNNRIVTCGVGGATLNRMASRTFLQELISELGPILKRRL